MASADTPKVIELFGIGLQHEGKATSAITPGMFVERSANKEVQPHSVAQGGGAAAFAQEMGMTGGTIDDDYAVGDQVIWKDYAVGSHVYALVPANAAAIAENANLVSNGDGTLRLQSAASTGIVVAKALEAVDNSAGATPARIRIEIVDAHPVTLA